MKKGIRYDEMSEEEATEIMFRDPGRWPLIPFLPVIRRIPNISCMPKSWKKEELGVIVLGHQTTIIETPLGLFAEEQDVDELLKKPNKYEYDSIEAMIEDGWLTD